MRTLCYLRIPATSFFVCFGEYIISLVMYVGGANI